MKSPTSVAKLNAAISANNLTEPEHIALIEDTTDIQLAEECTLETACSLLIERIGGTDNLRSYVNSLVAGKK